METIHKLLDKEMHDISIIIAVHNTDKYINRAVRSCLNQTLPRTDYEVVVINDGSDDNTGNLLSGFTDFYRGLGFLKVITLQENTGLSEACNEGIRQALGRYIVRVDSDDYVSERLLEIEQMFLEANKEFDAVACDYYKVDDYENVVHRFNCEDEPIACGIMFRKDRLIDVGLYRGKVGEDVDLRRRFLEKYKIWRLPLPLYRYRQREGSLTHANC